MSSSATVTNDAGPMAHLASFRGSLPIKAPYVCQQMFRGSFFDYPERRGWDKDKLYLGDFSGKTLEETQGFLQEWLYFGPLFHILDSPGMSFNPRDFIYQTEDGKEWITTETLPKYMEQWYFQPQFEYRGGRSLEQRQQTYRHVYSCLKEMHRYVLRFCGIDSNSGKYYPPATFWPLTSELSLSILVLADSLTKAGFEASGISFNLDWGTSGLLVERMIGSGWCPHVINTFTTSQQVHLHYSAETLGPPYKEKNHINCNEFTCTTDQIEEKSYITEHTEEGCQCEFKGPRINEVVEALGGGCIPLVECHETDNSLEVRIVKRTATSAHRNYVAISHVWSDGLGNPSQNTLPICQLRRLQRLVNGIGQTESSLPCSWWCDTLCVPVEKHLVAWRKSAIKRMRETYASADKVLVLDRGLGAVSISATTLEIYLRLQLSNWMRRLWTLQEGILGKTVIIQLLDGTKELSQIDKAMSQEEHQLRRFIYTRYSFDSYSVLGTFVRQGERPQHLSFDSYSKLLQWRSTSKQADETVCLMSMLGMSEFLEDLLKLEDNDYTGRMIHFFKSLTAIPISVLYQPPPRLPTFGFRWAPKSFLSCFRGTRAHPYRAIKGIGHIGPNGSGLKLKSAGLRLLESGDYLPQIGKIFLLQPELDGLDVLCVSYAGATADRNTDWAAKAVDGSTRLRRPAIIIYQELSSLGVIDGALVDINEESDDGRISCSYIAWVGLTVAAKTIYSISDLGLFHARILEKEQEWLVM